MSTDTITHLELRQSKHPAIDRSKDVRLHPLDSPKAESQFGRCFFSEAIGSKLDTQCGIPQSKIWYSENNKGS